MVPDKWPVLYLRKINSFKAAYKFLSVTNLQYNLPSFKWALSSKQYLHVHENLSMILT